MPGQVSCWPFPVVFPQLACLRSVHRLFHSFLHCLDNGMANGLEERLPCAVEGRKRLLQNPFTVEEDGSCSASMSKSWSLDSSESETDFLTFLVQIWFSFSTFLANVVTGSGN